MGTSSAKVDGQVRQRLHSTSAGLPSGSTSGSHSTRSVFVDSWGRSGKSSVSFHQTLLVINGSGGEVTPQTTGNLFDWGSKASGETIKRDAPARIKEFNSTTFEREVKAGNTHTYVGQTNWTNQQIQTIMNNLGNHYEVQFNNCRHVTVDTAFAITKRVTDGARDFHTVHETAKTIQTDRNKILKNWNTKGTLAMMESGSAGTPVMSDGMESGLHLAILDPRLPGVL